MERIIVARLREVWDTREWCRLAIEINGRMNVGAVGVSVNVVCVCAVLRTIVKCKW